LGGIGRELQRVHGQDYIEGIVGEGKALEVAELQIRARKTFARDGEHRFGDVASADDGTALASDRGRATGAASGIEKARACADVRGIERRAP